jgi:hypothetical protein
MTDAELTSYHKLRRLGVNHWRALATVLGYDPDEA